MKHTVTPLEDIQATKMGVDRRLLPIKIHYFIRFMGTGPLTVFLPVIAKQMGVPDKVVGDIWAVLAFVSLLTKTAAGTIADITRGHRAVFLLGLVLMCTSLTALYWVPDMPSPPPSPTHNASLSPNTSTLPPVSLFTSVTSFTSSPAGENTEATSDAVPTLTAVPSTQEGGDDWLLRHYEFWVLVLCLLGQYCGHITVITMQETVCFQLLGEARHKYGQQRVWGTIGIGLSAVISGALVDLYSKGLGRRDYLPAHIMTAVFLVADLFLVARLKFPLPERKMSSSALQGALWRPHVLLILVTTGVVGVLSGVVWTFEFLLVMDVAKQWQQPFPHLRLLQGLLTGVQSFLAEVPCLLVAGRIIQRLGHGKTLFVSLLGFTMRLVLYSVVSNPWLFLPIDLLHGISFGLAYPCFTSFASSVAPKGAAATTQAIFGAMFFGSTGVGGLVGGRLFESVGGKKTFLYIGAATGVYSLLFIVMQCVLAQLKSSGETDGGQDAETRKQEDMTEKRKGGKDEEEGDVKAELIKGRQKKGNNDMVMGMSYRRTEEGS